MDPVSSRVLLRRRKDLSKKEGDTGKDLGKKDGGKVTLFEITEI